MSANKRQPAFGLATAAPIAVSRWVEKMNVGRKIAQADADRDQNFMGYSRSLLAAPIVKVTAPKDAITVAGTLVKLNSDSADPGSTAIIETMTASVGLRVAMTARAPRVRKMLIAVADANQVVKSATCSQAANSAGTGYFSEVRSNAVARVHTLTNASGMNMERRACKVASVQSWKTQLYRKKLPANLVACNKRQNKPAHFEIGQSSCLSRLYS